MKKNCVICGSEFRVKPSHYDKVFCCGKECSREYPLHKVIKRVEEEIQEPLDKYLQREYIEKKRSLRWLIKELNINNRTAPKLLNKYGIDIRQGSEAVKAQWINNDERRKSAAELMDYARTSIPHHPRFLSEEEIQSRCSSADFEYVNRIGAKRIKIKCKSCGVEKIITPDVLLRDRNCAVCYGSTGERQIYKALKELGLNIKSQYRIEECRNERPLPFDFAVFDYAGNLQLLIEYDGKQHFNPEFDFGGKLDFLQLRTNDTIKTTYCIRKGIPLLRISYKQKENIESILANTFRLLA